MDKPHKIDILKEKASLLMFLAHPPFWRQGMTGETTPIIKRTNLHEGNVTLCITFALTFNSFQEREYKTQTNVLCKACLE